MARKVVRVGYKKTRAKGERFETEFKDRYRITVTLVSLKTLKDYDVDFTGEFYLRVKESAAHRSRTPNMGEIHLAKNQEITFNPQLTLWYEHVTRRQGEENARELKISLYERDPAKVDKKVASMRLVVKIPQKTEYIILQDEEEQTKAKLRVMCSRTRY
ncbi:MAG: hypothetical protein Kow0069_38710 [Promethearchaeota archaeon]